MEEVISIATRQWEQHYILVSYWKEIPIWDHFVDVCRVHDSLVRVDCDRCKFRRALHLPLKLPESTSLPHSLFKSPKTLQNSNACHWKELLLPNSIRKYIISYCIFLDISLSKLIQYLNLLRCSWQWPTSFSTTLGVHFSSSNFKHNQPTQYDSWPIARYLFKKTHSPYPLSFVIETGFPHYSWTCLFPSCLPRRPMLSIPLSSYLFHPPKPLVCRIHTFYRSRLTCVGAACCLRPVS